MPRAVGKSTCRLDAFLRASLVMGGPGSRSTAWARVTLSGAGGAVGAGSGDPGIIRDPAGANTSAGDGWPLSAQARASSLVMNGVWTITTSSSPFTLAQTP